MKRLFLALIIAAGPSMIYAQGVGPKTINAAGGYATIGSNEFEWSIGEMTMVSTISGSRIVVTQGVLQPFTSISGIKNVASITNLEVFPNPASSLVNIKYVSDGQGILSYRLLDMAGQVIKTGNIDLVQGTVNEQVNITSLACATYMLEVILNSAGKSSEQTTFKIQKLN